MAEFFTSPYFFGFLTIAGIHMMAVLVPGADFAITVKNSLTNTRKIGLFSALGTTLGMTFHLTYTLIGIAAFIDKSPMLFNCVRFAGAGYLMYIGYQALKAKSPIPEEFDFSKEASNQMTKFQALRSGFLTNALNPMVMVLFIGVFTSFIDESTPNLVKAMYAGEIITISIAWFGFVAFCFSNQKVRKFFARMGKWFDRLAGGALISFGVKLALTAAR